MYTHIQHGIIIVSILAWWIYLFCPELLNSLNRMITRLTRYALSLVRLLNVSAIGGAFIMQFSHHLRSNGIEVVKVRRTHWYPRQATVAKVYNKRRNAKGKGGGLPTSVSVHTHTHTHAQTHTLTYKPTIVTIHSSREAMNCSAPYPGSSALEVDISSSECHCLVSWLRSDRLGAQLVKEVTEVSTSSSYSYTHITR